MFRIKNIIEIPNAHLNDSVGQETQLNEKSQKMVN